MSAMDPTLREPSPPRTGRRLRAALACSSVLLALVWSSSAVAADKKVEAAAKTALKKAATDYQKSNYAAAVKRLQKALKACGEKKCTQGTKAALLRDLGTMQFRNDDVDAAKKSWAEAAAVQADIALNPEYDTPDVHAAFDSATGKSGAMGEQPSGDFSHTPAGEQRINTPLPVYVEYTGAGNVVRVIVKYKGATMGDWGSTELTKSVGNGWAGQIPCSAVTKGTLRYWVQGFDRTGDATASSGDPQHPFAVPIKDDIEGAPPHLPGQGPPKSCSEDTECPSGLPGCAREESKAESPPAAEEKSAPATFAHYWFGITGALDFISMPSGQDVCVLSPQTAAPLNSAHYYCTNPDGSDFPLRNDGGAQNGQLRPGQAGAVSGGLQPGDVRVMFSFDYALTPSILVGARGGYVANAYTGKAAINDGHAYKYPIDLEARGTYLFGERPLLNIGFAPMAFVGGGVSEFDGHSTTLVNVMAQQPVNAWVTGGPWFAVVGGGARYAFSLRAAVTMAVRVNAAFGKDFVATYGPEVGIQYGF